MGSFTPLPVLALLLGVPPQRLPEFRVESSLVMLSLTAWDAKRRPVRDLRREEVRVFDEGELRELRYFARAEAVPAYLLLLVDASGSMAGHGTASASMAALQLLAALRPEDEAALASFDGSYRTLQPLTTDKMLVQRRIADVKTFGSTALSDAVARATRELAAQGGNGRRAVVLLSDGVDTASRSSEAQAAAVAESLDVPVYALSIVSSLEDPGSPLFTGVRGAAARGRAALDRFAAASGGLAFTVSDFTGLKRATDQIVEEISSQYRLGYEPPAGPARPLRSLNVTTTRKGVSLRTRRGYSSGP